MSFKRDGNDYALLRNLTKRRVCDLLVNHIPEDEALLLKNGKYSCTVCFHKPIFDTLEMLSLHRKGKKHLANLTEHLAKHVQAKEVEVKPSFQANNKPLVSNDLESKSLRKKPSLLKNKPYNSCRRKLKIDIAKMPVSDSSIGNKSTTSASTNVAQVHETPSAQSLIRNYIKTSQKKKDFMKVVAQSRRNVVQPAQSNWKESASQTGKNSSSQNQPKQTDSCRPDDIGEEQKRKCAYYLQLRSSGWKRDREGRWIKSEEAEFDSDEEEPPEYPG